MSYGYNCDCDKCKGNYKQSVVNKLEDIQVLIQEQVQLQAQLQAQLQVQLQAQAQNQNDTDTISNVGNPNVNINISNTANAENAENAENGADTLNSAFRATSLAVQPVPVLTPVNVSLPVEEFDLENEYNPSTSVFTAKEAGVYSFSAAVEFNPIPTTVNYQTAIFFVVNNVFENADDEFTGANAPFFNIIEINDILKLNAGDQVRVVFRSTTGGNIIGINRNTRFAGVKVQ